jgi:type VI secretion system Hcp family effector
MNRGGRSVVAACLCLLGLALSRAVPADAAFDMFLKVYGIQGESTDDKHKGEIDVQAWSWAVDAPPPRPGGKTVPEYSDLTIRKRIDKASPALFYAGARGQLIRDAALTVRQAGGEQAEFFRIMLEDVRVTSLTDVVNDAAEGPLEGVTLNYGNISFFYTPTGSGIEPPRVVNPGTRTNAEGDAVSLQMTAVAPYVDGVTFSASGLPPGLSITTEGLIAGTLPFDSAGSYGVTVFATDPGGLRGAALFTWNVTNSNRAPQVDNIVDRAGLEGDAVSLQLSASDLDGEALAWSAAGLPAGLAIDPATGLIGGVIAANASGSYPVTVTVTDPGGLSATASFTWTVTLGQLRIGGLVANKGWTLTPGVMYVDVALKNSGTGNARNVVVKTVVPRTLMGTGVTTLNSASSLPRSIGDLAVGASVTVRFYFNVPATVTRFSVTEGGTAADVRGTIFNYSTGQALVP